MPCETKFQVTKFGQERERLLQTTDRNKYDPPCVHS